MKYDDQYLSVNRRDTGSEKVIQKLILEFTEKERMLASRGGVGVEANK